MNYPESHNGQVKSVMEITYCSDECLMEFIKKVNQNERMTRVQNIGKMNLILGSNMQYLKKINFDNHVICLRFYCNNNAVLKFGLVQRTET